MIHVCLYSGYSSRKVANAALSSVDVESWLSSGLTSVSCAMLTVFSYVTDVRLAAVEVEVVPVPECSDTCELQAVMHENFLRSVRGGCLLQLASEGRVLVLEVMLPMIW